MPMLLGFWVTFAITVGLWLVTTTYTENQSNQLFDETSKTFWHLGFDYLFLIGIVLILAISYVRHQVRSRRATAGIGRDRFPRLILPGVLIPFVLLKTVASMYGNWTCMRCWQPPCEQCFAPLGLTEWFLGNAWWVLLLGGFVIQVFPQGFKLACRRALSFPWAPPLIFDSARSVLHVGRIREVDGRRYVMQLRQLLRVGVWRWIWMACNPPCAEPFNCRYAEQVGEAHTCSASPFWGDRELSIVTV
jgi:hypothetical protein